MEAFDTPTQLSRINLTPCTCDNIPKFYTTKSGKSGYEASNLLTTIVFSSTNVMTPPHLQLVVFLQMIGTFNNSLPHSST